jgi:hypothetical protein
VTAFAGDGLNHARNAFVVVAVCDDENGHRCSVVCE